MTWTNLRLGQKIERLIERANQDVSIIATIIPESFKEPSECLLRLFGA